MTQEPVKRVVLVDFSIIAQTIFNSNARTAPEPNAVADRIVAKVRWLAANGPCAVCCEGGRTFRHEADPEYKANRPDKDAVYVDQTARALEQLRAEGFPVWSVPGYEADDVIASAVRRLTAQYQAPIIVVSRDKDLLMLVSDTVRWADPTSQAPPLDVKTATEKLGVFPHQVRDLLTLVGDAADNYKGAEGIGQQTAAKLLAKFGSLDDIYKVLDAGDVAKLGLPVGIVRSLKAFRTRLDHVRKLSTLVETLDVPVHEVFEDRYARSRPQSSDDVTLDDDPDEGFGDVDDPEDAVDTPEETDALDEPISTTTSGDVSTLRTSTPEPIREHAQAQGLMPQRRQPQPPTALARREVSLEPTTPAMMMKMAAAIFNGRMFEGYGNPNAVFITIKAGQELGLPAITSLRTIHVVKGRHSISAQMMVALVRKSGLAEYFDVKEITDKRCTIATRRVGSTTEQVLTHTIEMAHRAQLVKPDSNWLKSPEDMLYARCSARLCRMVYPDVINNMYDRYAEPEAFEGDRP